VEEGTRWKIDTAPANPKTRNVPAKRKERAWPMLMAMLMADADAGADG